jgi:hypothetical protein
LGVGGGIGGGGTHAKILKICTYPNRLIEESMEIERYFFYNNNNNKVIDR